MRLQCIGFFLKAGVKGAYVQLQLVNVGLNAGRIFVVLVGEQAQMLGGMLKVASIGVDDAGLKNLTRLGLQGIESSLKFSNVFFARRGHGHGQGGSAHQLSDVSA